MHPCLLLRHDYRPTASFLPETLFVVSSCDGGSQYGAKLSISTKQLSACCVRCSIEKYQEQFSFLRDSRFIQDLENDSVDSDLIEEELRALKESAIRFLLFQSYSQQPCISFVITE